MGPELPVSEVMEVVSRHSEGSDERLKPDARLLMNDNSNLGSELGSKHPKKPSHIRTFPWAGFVSLVAIVLLTFAALGLLLFSNASLVDSWRVNGIKIQPQVWLSILTTLMDGLTAFALVDGASTNFWRKTSKGATLQNLYDIYESQAFVGAAKSLLRLRPSKVAITALLCLASTLRGPLFQRASVVTSNYATERVKNHELRVAQLIPPGYLHPDFQVTTTRFDAVLDQYTERTPVYINITGSECKGSCTGKVKGYGFDIKCSNSTIAWDSSNNSTVIELYQAEGNQLRGTVPSFNTSAHLQGYVGPDDDESSRPSFDSAEEHGWLDTISLFKTQPICGGELSITNCSLHHAVLEYAVEIRNYTIRLQHPHWQDDRVLFQTPTWNSEEFSQDRWGPTTFWLILYMLLFNQEISIKENGHGYVSEGDVRLLLVKRFVNEDFNSINCSTTFRDPTQYILDRMREIVFRTAVAAANNVSDTKMLFGLPSLVADGLPLIQNWTQTVELMEQNVSVVFIVSTPYLIAAVVASLLAVVAISPLYWGWKELPLPPSFNPVVVANAFDAPDFKDMDVWQIGKCIRNEHGLRRVRFPPHDDKTEGLALR
ncbi:hypothetical protein BCR34DRAFT_133713 [Clohesyomyces aquaticus]|uniref:Uncharacterized protein n=1 Tax=Clohesyomyces aquaticus TaxID=1231657 RepID=A0A1Y2AAL3_9PLEO|nr:hypothetical protein BCR34DRAFT_133713 [Clohesyomyces aquaticus]